MFAEKHAYARAPTEDDDSDLESHAATTADSNARLKSLMRNGGLLLTLFLTVLSGLSLVANLAPSPQISRLSTEPKWSSCGNDSATARSRGCSFDLISFAWQTPECYDGELVSEFASWNGSWTYYADRNFTQIVDQDVAMRGERKLYVEWSYHLVHCTFMWRQMHRAYERGWIDAHLGNYNHTLHCGQMILMDPEETQHTKTAARLIYPECLRTGGGKPQKIVETEDYRPALEVEEQTHDT